MIQLRYFASLREKLGLDSEQIEPREVHAQAALTVADVRAHLLQRGSPWDEALSEDQRVLAAVNQEMARPDTAVADGDELAFFPPVTGG